MTHQEDPMPAPVYAEWSPADSTAALAEGWDLFECAGPDHHPWELQRVDFPDNGPAVFDGDPDAWRHVNARAAEGSGLHQRALAFLAVHSPGEHHVVTGPDGQPATAEVTAP